jgi:hypothetical protein
MDYIIQKDVDNFQYYKDIFIIDVDTLTLFMVDIQNYYNKTDDNSISKTVDNEEKGGKRKSRRKTHTNRRKTNRRRRSRR